MHNQPSDLYPYKRISTLDSLGKALGIEVSLLEGVAQNLNFYYRKNRPKDGRITYSVLEPLKMIQKKIKKKLLGKINYPPYLHGYIKSRSAKTNAQAHINKKILINEDIEKFFDNCNSDLVFSIWVHVFKFSSEVADLLTHLTTFDNKLPQGTKTSPSLSNLAFWKHEQKLASKLTDSGLTYTRYADDITVSTSKILTSLEIEDIISQIFNLMRKNGFKPNRNKHKISRPSGKMLVNGQVVNSKRVTQKKGYSLKVRAEIHNFNKNWSVLTDMKRKDVCETIKGKIGYISNYNPQQALKLIAQLEKEAL